jgi:hypothetical protein
LLECLTGEKAFPGPIVEAAVARLLRDPEIPEDLGAEWGQLLRAMTAREASARPTAHDVALTLRSWTQAPIPLHPGKELAEEPAGHSGVDTGNVTTGNVIIPAPPNRAPSVG